MSIEDPTAQPPFEENQSYLLTGEGPAGIPTGTPEAEGGGGAQTETSPAQTTQTQSISQSQQAAAPSGQLYQAGADTITQGLTQPLYSGAGRVSRFATPDAVCGPYSRPD